MSGWRDPRLGERHETRLPSGTLGFHERGSGPVLVFAHGYLVNANLWRKVVPLLAERFRCITPDLPLGAHLVPMRRDADLSPPGIARMIADLLAELDLHDVTLFGNDSGGAYSQLVAANHPERVGGLVLSSCETPEDTWPPSPGGFGLLKATASNPLTYRALYQVLRFPRTWRWRNTYGWLAKYPIDAEAMESYVRPVIERADIRFDGRKAIGAVSARYTREAAGVLAQRFTKPVRMVWAAEDHVFPLGHATRYARELGAELHTVADSCTYVTEDQPEAVAKLLKG
ncbi:alpha/beta hydrolase [Amycolatopsis acidicola]|uniref:Alpha/beta hydrolase n=1 Tax=Amycolatopsis acidicola TaxID=2596893 RepID=A0A5N0UXB8_9PSEU|nr:alpha/beta hydrolase [Amycolatopsis acidicola]KAA9155262.1 alpha/beta hydrolase [Amycolatopsis acidicola]